MKHRNPNQHPQRLAAAGVLLFVCGLLVACESPHAATTSSSQPSGAAEGSPAVIEKLTAGLIDYAGILSADGWLPLRDREACLAQAATPGGNACRNIPGLQSCDAGHGMCRLRYARLGSAQAVELAVAATDVGSDMLELGALQSATAIPLPQTAPSAPVACPSSDFRGFLEAFAARPDIRIGLSAPLLRFEQVVEDEASDESRREVLVQSARYTGFMLGHHDGSFRLINSAGEDQGAIDLVITPQGSDAVDVALPDNVEGIAYTFRKHGDCWQFEGSPSTTP